MSGYAIAPAEAEKAVREGRAILIDIRERAEHARASIPGAVLVPLSGLEQRDLSDEKRRSQVVIFHCQSGMRTRANLARLCALGFPETRILDGGLAAWSGAGLPVRSSAGDARLSQAGRLAGYALIVSGIALATFAFHLAGGVSALAGSALLLAQGKGFFGGVQPGKRAG